jgi:hypothetical protein
LYFEAVIKYSLIALLPVHYHRENQKASRQDLTILRPRMLFRFKKTATFMPPQLSGQNMGF